MKIVGNSQYQKGANGLLILNLLRKYPCSRVQIAHELGLQNSTVTYSVARLLENGTVREVETEKPEVPEVTKIGRKPNLVGLNPDFGRIIGIEMMSGLYRVCICDICGMVLVKEELHYAKKNSPFQELVAEALGIASAKCGNFPILGACIAVPGIVHDGNTCIEECWTHDLKNVEFKPFLQTFPFPVLFENDANCCALKYMFNRDDQNDNFFYLLARKHDSEVVPAGIPTIGLGLGLVVHGKLIRGASSRSGEYRSSRLMGTKSNGQIDLTEEQLKNLDTDASIQRDLIKRVFADLFCAISIFDPSNFYVGGFLTSLPYRYVLGDVLSHELQDDWFETKWEGEMILVHDTLFDPAEGAADKILELLFKVPHVGSSEPDLRQWNALLNGII
ncbi:transcriptional regulator/sugar kinase [Sphaerochaeta pleomorpha str. Grapes]|uniref:Transcriptional regulator/sugar kinase n=1 Tax=Sphaerochaeta pleomorpha (strain ATCC BAA-1885 / DSM 22778 / Grapes) TaxID=158190 RepID=G8QVE9_SPHPG|nr:ROK family transcriptional regulator [Sphaerochaeta pleomorpha]AEV28182.1 transcriptional regulator/sugar kinase [Sphaerochaeta pleomorpha str. Grapes]